MKLIDAHCHMDSKEFDADRAETIARAKAAGLQRAVLIGLWRAPGDFGESLAMRDADPFFAATIGIHPHESADAPEADYAAVERLAHDARVVGIGETGLDYHYDHSPRDVQQQAFRRGQAQMLQNRTCIPVSSLEGPFWDFQDTQDAQLAYAQSLAMVQLVLDVAGTDAVVRLTQALAAGDEPARAVERVAGRPLGCSDLLSDLDRRK